MTRVFAIAGLAVRTLVRSRLLIFLLLLLLLTVAGIPAVVKGDGTLEGKIRVLIQYTLTLSAILLGTATVWASCSSLSEEIAGRQIQLLAVKPVPRWQIWLGKWLGILAMDAFLLGFAGAAVWVFAWWHTRPAAVPQEEALRVRQQVLVGRRLVPARAGDAEGEARRRLAALVREKRLPPEVSPADALPLLIRQVRVEQDTVTPGQSRQWVFDLPAASGFFSCRPPSGDRAWLRIRFASAGMGREFRSGTWSLGTASRPDLYSFPMERKLDGVHQFPVPVNALVRNEPLLVRFANAARETSDTVVFSHSQGVEILIPEISFGANLARALLILLGYFALLAALGLSAGALFSFPVATFFSVSVIVVALLSHFFIGVYPSAHHGHSHRHSSEPEEPPSLMDRMGDSLGRQTARAVAPILEVAPLGLLSDGILVSGDMVRRALLLLAVVYPAMFGLIGAASLGRRELALPER